jgi:hypothetical protein
MVHAYVLPLLSSDHGGVSILLGERFGMYPLHISFAVIKMACCMHVLHGITANNPVRQTKTVVIVAQFDHPGAMN